ncbi:two-component regulator propeller domain-containing protein [Rufibacter sp. DG15C]|uniref:ligand-binding sensor domain-containing protein n=1 Tax=Rufibacter sp. DG15C TaxID=1379909 RepID=UPI0018D34A66|nr:two-component regulator propeller domain-containing protein [Rufibacter sp. DG15C]
MLDFTHGAEKRKITMRQQLPVTAKRHPTPQIGKNLKGHLTMKSYLSSTKFVAFLTILLLGTACNGTVKREVSKEKASESNITALAPPKLIKTIGNPRYGNVQCSLQDQAGNLWFGTTENGLYKYDGKSFTQFLVTDGLSSNDISSLLEDKDGNLWIGTKAGLCLYDGKTFARIQIPLPKNLPPNKNPYYSDSHRVTSMMQAKSGKLWFVTIDGVYVYDGKSFTLFIVDEAANGFLTSNDKVEQIFEDKAGNIWLGGRTNEGVYRYDGKSVTNLKLTVLFQNGPKPKAHSWGWPQVQDKNGNIWFSNWGGAYRYDGKSITSFTEKDGMPGEVTRIIEDRQGSLWFGGADGLSRYDGKSFTRFTKKDGLVNPWVWSILEDKTGNLWVGTRETGLYLFDGNRLIAYSEYKRSPVSEE